MFYSDEDFAAKVDEKLGNVRYFKKCLRERGMIGSRQQLSDDFIATFEEVRQVREKLNSTWEQAMVEVLNRDNNLVPEGMFKIQISETWKTDERRDYTFTLMTYLPFVPQIGLRWEDSDKDINLKVENLTYHSDKGVFLIRNTVRDADREEVEARIAARQGTGWSLPILD
ncbi:hypothetical protein V1499_22950 (plasmid) [Neobacillus sp. SCS-31]|uniref:hypothetical protein n=1 Tax=Neobacillus oceani TaxID=3115292 RepID=UPI00390666DF